ncbi:hypothetical protein H7Y29_02010 [Microbacteriaceae bacterium]|nr:hypothetical protein [Candidatus Saccharibacteria bacterium]
MVKSNRESSFGDRLRRRIAYGTISVLGATGLAACGPSVSAEKPPVTASPSATPSPSETGTPTPVPSETAPSTDAISEQLMSDAVDATKFATYPREARVDAGLYVVDQMRETLDNVELFDADLPNGENLWDNNPVDSPLDKQSSFEKINNQNLFFQQLITSQRAKAGSNIIDQNKALKVAYSTVIDTKDSEAKNWEETIPKLPNGEIAKFSTKGLNYKIPKNQELVKTPFTLEDGTETTKVTGVINVDKDNYIVTYVFQDVPQLGEGKGVWLKTSTELQK